MLAHASFLQGLGHIPDHARIAAEHCLGAIRMQDGSGCGFQTAIDDRLGNAPRKHRAAFTHRFPADQGNRAELARMLRQNGLDHVAVGALRKVARALD
jgi:hypothetical protein